MLTHEEYKAAVEERLEKLLPQVEENFKSRCMPKLLNNAMRYSLLAGGKRLRPCMLLAACELCGGKITQAIDFACAIEMIHTYSLIHDDLPGMDNDTLRRGRPTNHVVFGEGQAILAGDGLLSYAFETMLAAAAKESDVSFILRAVYAMKDIAIAAGTEGMVAGQCADLYAENEKQSGKELLDYIQAGKTAAMFIGAVKAGAHLAGAEESEVIALERFALAFGKLFQVTDDILDITADETAFGKSKGKDAEEGKLTAVSEYTLEGAARLAGQLKDESLNALDSFNENADYFRKLVNEMYERKA